MRPRAPGTTPIRPHRPLGPVGGGAGAGAPRADPGLGPARRSAAVVRATSVHLGFPASNGWQLSRGWSAPGQIASGIPRPPPLVRPDPAGRAPRTVVASAHRWSRDCRALGPGCRARVTPTRAHVHESTLRASSIRHRAHGLTSRSAVSQVFERSCSMVDPITADELVPEPARARPPARDAEHDRGVAGAGRRAADRPVVRLPPQRRDLVPLRLDLQAPPRLLQVGGHGGICVVPRPARPLPVPARHRSHRLRGHPAQPGTPQGAADLGRGHDPRDEQRHLRRHLLGAPRVRHRRRRDRTSPRVSCGRSRHYAASSPASRRSTGDAVSSRTATRPRRLDGRPTISSGQGNVQLLEHEQRALVQPNFDRLSCAFARLFSIGSALSFEVRGVRHELVVLHVVLPLLAQARDPAGSARAGLAEDHPIRRPLALDRDEHRPPLPEVRCRHRTWSTPACAASSTRPMTTPPTPASCRVQRGRVSLTAL